MNLEKLLENRFTCDCEQEPFVDQGSHVALTLSRSQLGIKEIAPGDWSIPGAR